MHFKWVVACLAVASTWLMAPSALADADSDYHAVINDYRDHNGDVTPCKFTRAQLVNARDKAAEDPFVSNYVPEFGVEVKREIQRYDAGGCLGTATTRGLRILKIRPRGRESITIRNTGVTKASLKSVTLRDASGNRVRLGSGSLGAGRSLRVFTSCARRHRRALRKGNRLYACRSGTVWNNKGDVVKIVTSRGVVLAQRGYGSRKDAELI
jgi:hypothetical protein